MNVVLWIVTSLLALAFLASGSLKLVKSKSQLAESGMDWVEDFGPGVIKVIGALEVLGAVGLVLPAAVDVAPTLVPLAALGLVVVMAGAAITHVRRREPQPVGVTLGLLAIAAFVAWGRFGPYAF